MRKDSKHLDFRANNYLTQKQINDNLNDPVSVSLVQSLLGKIRSLGSLNTIELYFG